MLYKQQAIIIKLRDLGEADKIVVLLGKDKGRIECVAKGVRKPTSRKSAQTDLANLGNFSLATGKTLDVITEIKLINSFPKIKASIIKTAATYYVLQLIDQFYQDENQGEEIFDSLENTIETLEELDEDYKKIITVLLCFQTKLLKLSGFLETGLANIKEEDFHTRLTKILNFFQNSPISEAPRLLLNDQDIDMLDHYLYNQIQNVLEKDLASYRFFKQVSSQ